jgi:hypothetical protein
MRGAHLSVERKPAPHQVGNLESNTCFLKHQIWRERNVINLLYLFSAYYGLFGIWFMTVARVTEAQTTGERQSRVPFQVSPLPTPAPARRAPARRRHRRSQPPTMAPARRRNASRSPFPLSPTPTPVTQSSVQPQVSSFAPTYDPSTQATEGPSRTPVRRSRSTFLPSGRPVRTVPSRRPLPSRRPVRTRAPTSSVGPSFPEADQPSMPPSDFPTATRSSEPSAVPTSGPSDAPTSEQTSSPTAAPSIFLTVSPSAKFVIREMPNIRVYFVIELDANLTRSSDEESKSILRLAAGVETGLGELLSKVLEDNINVASSFDSLQLDVNTAIQQRTDSSFLLSPQIEGTARFQTGQSVGSINGGIPTKESLAKIYSTFFGFLGTWTLQEFLNGMTPDSNVTEVVVDVNGRTLGTDDGGLTLELNQTGTFSDNGTNPEPPEAPTEDKVDDDAANEKRVFSISLISGILLVTLVVLAAALLILRRHGRRRSLLIALEKGMLSQQRGGASNSEGFLDAIKSPAVSVTSGSLVREEPLRQPTNRDPSTDAIPLRLLSLSGSEVDSPTDDSSSVSKHDESLMQHSTPHEGSQQREEDALPKDYIPVTIDDLIAGLRGGKTVQKRSSDDAHSNDSREMEAAAVDDFSHTGLTSMNDSIFEDRKVPASPLSSGVLPYDVSGYDVSRLDSIIKCAKESSERKQEPESNEIACYDDDTYYDKTDEDTRNEANRVTDDHTQASGE